MRVLILRRRSHSLKSIQRQISGTGSSAMVGSISFVIGLNSANLAMKSGAQGGN
jgi:hypothetical protein